MSIAPLADQLRGASIDIPRSGSYANSSGLPVAGWALGRHDAVRTIDLSASGHVTRRVRPSIHRPDVAAHFGVDGRLLTGFETSLDVSDSSVERIDVTATLRTGDTVALGSIGLRRFWHRGNHPMEASVVSIVITAFNQACFLPDAIESCLRQRYPLIEILVVDDGSSDNTLEVTSRYPGVRYVRQANEGVAGARNTGIRRTNGEFVMFLDADDRLADNAVALNVEHLQSRPDCAFVSGEHCYIGIDGQRLKEWTRTVTATDHYAALLRGNYIGCPAAVVYRRAVFQAVGNFTADCQPCEDYDLYLRIARRFPVTAHDKLIAEYRKYGSSVSTEPGGMLSAALRVLRTHRPRLSDGADARRAMREGRRYWQAYYGEALAAVVRHKLLRPGKRLESARALWQLIRLAPRELPRLFSMASIETPR